MAWLENPLLITATAKIAKQLKVIDDPPSFKFLVTISYFIYTDLINNQKDFQKGRKLLCLIIIDLIFFKYFFKEILFCFCFFMSYFFYWILCVIVMHFCILQFYIRKKLIFRLKLIQIHTYWFYLFFEYFKDEFILVLMTDNN